MQLASKLPDTVALNGVETAPDGISVGVPGHTIFGLYPKSLAYQPANEDVGSFAPTGQRRDAK